MPAHNDILELVGKTPLVRLRTGLPDGGAKAFVKLEFFNPTGSLKYRMALHIIRRALADGRLYLGDKFVDHSSGNTASALEMVAVAYA